MNTPERIWADAPDGIICGSYDVEPYEDATEYIRADIAAAALDAEKARADAAEAALKTAREAILQDASRDYPQEVVDWLRSIANTLIQEPRT